MNKINTSLFSIVTAVYNDKSGLWRTAESLAAQTCRNFEWIVIDGGSTDGTAEFLKTVTLISEWVSERDEGIADAWNKGIRRSKGRFVVLLNAGDTFDTDYLETMACYAVDDRIACCHARLATETGCVIGTMRAEPGKLWRGMHLPHNWCVVPKRVYAEIGDYPKLQYSMDYAWVHRYFLQYGRTGFIVVPKILGTFHLGGKSDRGYRASFKENARILRKDGMNVVLTRLLYLAYTFKHCLIYRLLSHRKTRRPPN
jgi:glycosyltransferase involved in cell wall biosynthesis